MKILLIALVSIVGFFVALRLLENRMVFFPYKYPQGFWQPSAFGLEVKDCFFEASDGTKLHGWFLKKEGANQTLLWCHGNAGNISDRLDNLARLSKLPINIFLFDYRGYGRSEGTPTESGVYLDALAAYDYVVGEHSVAADSLVIFGRSLGGAVAVELAVNRPCRKLILESTFASARDMAKEMFGVIPVHLSMKSRFDSVEKIRQIKMPLLMIHGRRDQVVPFELGKRLYDVANMPKSFYEIAEADHNDTYVVGGQAYINRLAEFLAQ